MSIPKEDDKHLRSGLVSHTGEWLHITPGKCSFQVNRWIPGIYYRWDPGKPVFLLFFCFIIKSMYQSFRLLIFHVFGHYLYPASHACLWESGGEKCSVDFCITECP